ncbi:MAG: methylglyoxal synthase [Chlorobi bacterium]|nr:methylglyoxal synthase [Chlorobiota bacterium]
MIKRKNIALVAHDTMKRDMIEWVNWNRDLLTPHRLICTGTTGKLIEETLLKQVSETKTIGHDALEIIRLKSGPLGGDQQLGAMIAEEKIDVFVFFWDPMEPQPHDVDVKALLRIAVLYNIPTASNRCSADYLITSPLFKQDYKIPAKDYSKYLNRKV